MNATYDVQPQTGSIEQYIIWQTDDTGERIVAILSHDDLESLADALTAWKEGTK